jgi:hypothetical protein
MHNVKLKVWNLYCLDFFFNRFAHMNPLPGNSHCQLWQPADLLRTDAIQRGRWTRRRHRHTRRGHALWPLPVSATLAATLFGLLLFGWMATLVDCHWSPNGGLSWPPHNVLARVIWLPENWGRRRKAAHKQIFSGQIGLGYGYGFIPIKDSGSMVIFSSRVF